MNFDNVNKELFSFLDHSPNAFFAVRNMCDLLEQAGMIRLYEGAPWSLAAGRGYYVTRNDSYCYNGDLATLKKTSAGKYYMDVDFDTGYTQVVASGDKEERYTGNDKKNSSTTGGNNERGFFPFNDDSLIDKDDDRVLKNHARYNYGFATEFKLNFKMRSDGKMIALDSSGNQLSDTTTASNNGNHYESNS